MYSMAHDNLISQKIQIATISRMDMSKTICFLLKPKSLSQNNAQLKINLWLTIADNH